MQRLFTDRQERRICAAYAKGETQYTLAARFKCSQATAGDILRRHLSKETMRRVIRGNRSRGMKGRTFSAKTRRRMSIARKRLNLRGPRSPIWKGGRRGDGNGYIRVYAPAHPHACANAVAEHRLVMEKRLGRYLRRDEMVHHKNGVRDDNRLSNLQVVTHANHRGCVQCPFCRETFAVQ